MKVGCAGILVADTVCGPLAAMPEEGQLVAIDRMPTSAGGCASNVAIDLAKQGIQTEVVGCLGVDHAGDVLISCLTADGANCERVIRRDTYPTSTTMILLIEGQDRRYIHVVGANRSFRVSDIPRHWVAQLDVFYLGGLFAMPDIDPDELAELFRFCRDNQVLTVLDVVVPEGLSVRAKLSVFLPYVDCFLPNKDEACALTGQAAIVDQVRLFREMGVKTMIVTCGHNGALAAQDDQFWQAGTYSTDVVDPSGSGDAFAAGVITGLGYQWPMEKTLRYATALGASATNELGTTAGVFTAEQAQRFICEHELDVIVSSTA